MKKCIIDEEVSVHPVDGMQLSQGSISMDESSHYVGQLPGLPPSQGNTIDEVLSRMERKAKAFYGDDVVVEILSHTSAG